MARAEAAMIAWSRMEKFLLLVAFSRSENSLSGVAFRDELSMTPHVDLSASTMQKAAFMCSACSLQPAHLGGASGGGRERRRVVGDAVKLADIAEADAAARMRRHAR